MFVFVIDESTDYFLDSFIIHLLYRESDIVKNAQHNFLKSKVNTNTWIISDNVHLEIQIKNSRLFSVDRLSF